MASRDHGPDGRGAPGPETQHRPVEGAVPEAARRRPEDPPIRNPDQYSLTDHVRKRLVQGGRYVTVEGVDDAIREGQLRWNTSDGWRFARVVDGVRLVVAVCDTETASPVVVTAWTEVADIGAAEAAERWDRTDIETIRLRSTLSERADEHVPEHIRPRDVPRPFYVRGHRLVTDPGVGHLRCVDCSGRFRSKGELDRRRCSR
ncbi:hypothetical protein [Halolamina salifodinae]|uniref:Uncharacterized protein n=1 Tax=Halolamina salifodinae TaxID=1202767 RepID=A0A8T4H361_9EURY|nr:hypothetical protein [Halolamina salifodinae]MBP1988065.1 hypothetical protein [Halolamina salifodinae]